MLSALSAIPTRERENMAKLPKFTVEFNEQQKKWELQQDQTNKVLKTFKTKAEVVKGGVLAKAVGTEGGSVKIQLKSGRFEEERTYPRSKDPKSRG
jgi:hypothetical protein